MVSDDILVKRTLAGDTEWLYENTSNGILPNPQGLGIFFERYGNLLTRN
jgi:hypothetical protein